MIPFCRGGLQAGRAGAIHHGHLEVGQRALKCRQPSPAVPTRPPGRGLPLVSLGGPRTPCSQYLLSPRQHPPPRFLGCSASWEECCHSKSSFPKWVLGGRGVGHVCRGVRATPGRLAVPPRDRSPEWTTPLLMSSSAQRMGRRVSLASPCQASAACPVLCRPF